MTCPLPQPCWWGRYLAGEFKTPQELVAAALAELGTLPTPAQSFFQETPGELVELPPLERLKAPAWFHNSAYLRQQERAIYNHADPRLIVWAATFQAMAKSRGIPLYVHAALRGEAEQNALAAKGNSKLRYPSSAHNIGEAVDIVHGVFHWDMSEKEWEYLHALGRLALDRVNAHLRGPNKLDLAWGGNWSFYDPAHWEIRDYRQRLRRLPDVPITTATRYTHTQALKNRDRLLAGL